MAENTNDDFTTLQVRLPIEISEALEDAASERLVSKSRLVQLAVTDMLDRLVPMDELVLLRPSSENQPIYGPPEPPAA